MPDRILDFKGLPLSIREVTAPKYWRARKVIALNPEESHGIHNIYVRCFRGGERVFGVTARMFWPDGEAIGQTENKPLIEFGDWNAPMYGDWKPELGPGPYGADIRDGTPSEAVLGMGLPRKQHYSYQIEFEEVSGEPTGDLAEELRAAAAHYQVMRLNPVAALQKVILRDGFVPTSEEFPLTNGGVSYVAQRAEHLGDGVVRVYYAVTGRWSEVYFV